MQILHLGHCNPRVERNKISKTIQYQWHVYVNMVRVCANVLVLVNLLTSLVCALM